MAVLSITSKSQTPGIEDIQELIRSQFLSCLQRSSYLESAHIAEAAFDEPVYDQYISLIMLHSDVLSVTLKGHFSLETARKSLAGRHGKPWQDIGKELALDYMKEMFNVAAGRIKSHLAANNISIGISIPFITRGFDELLFSDKINPHEIHDYCQVGWDDQKITLCSQIFINDISFFDDFKLTINNADTNGGKGEFL